MVIVKLIAGGRVLTFKGRRAAVEGRTWICSTAKSEGCTSTFLLDERSAFPFTRVPSAKAELVLVVFV